MPVSLYELLGGDRELAIKYGKNTLHVTYDPGAYTYEHEQRLNAIVEEERKAGDNRGAAMAIARLIMTINKWDLVDADGQPVPLTQEGLRTVPRRALDEIYIKVLADMAVPKGPSTD